MYLVEMLSDMGEALIRPRIYSLDIENPMIRRMHSNYINLEDCIPIGTPARFYAQDDIEFRREIRQAMPEEANAVLCLAPRYKTYTPESQFTVQWYKIKI